MNPSIILINPWIYDFAAYDMWSKPLGLLYIGGYLRESGFRIYLIDCLDIHHPLLEKKNGLIPPKRHNFGTGKFWKCRIPPPPTLSHINRPYHRYGITEEILISELKRVPEPALILVTSLMTYWYPGVIQTINICKDTLPHVPIILGGIYARLCPEHAKANSGADYILTGQIPRVTDELISILEDNGLIPRNIIKPGLGYPLPCYDLLGRLEYVSIITSTGCPFRCRYCSTPYLQEGRMIRRNPDDVIEEITFWHRRYGITDFAFYDDALLIDFENHLSPVLEGIMKNNIKERFHTPNAIHIKAIEKDTAKLMFRAGFTTIRLGLESIDTEFHHRFDRKLSIEELEMAVENLREAGFTFKQLGAYIMIGLPGQSPISVEKTIRYAGRLKIQPFLSEYSPVPHTELWDEAVKEARFDIESDPIFHNNTLLPCWDEERLKSLPYLKNLALQIRHELEY